METGGLVCMVPAIMGRVDHCLPTVSALIALPTVHYFLMLLRSEFFLFAIGGHALHSA